MSARTRVRADASIGFAKTGFVEILYNVHRLHPAAKTHRKKTLEKKLRFVFMNLPLTPRCTPML
jgi:hypothetical protein